MEQLQSGWQTESAAFHAQPGVEMVSDQIPIMFN
jgi:hypothetical protein